MPIIQRSIKRPVVLEKSRCRPRKDNCTHERLHYGEDKDLDDYRSAGLQKYTLELGPSAPL